MAGTFRSLKLLMDDDDGMVMMYLTRAHKHPSMLDNLSMFEPEEVCVCDVSLFVCCDTLCVRC